MRHSDCQSFVSPYKSLLGTVLVLATVLLVGPLGCDDKPSGPVTPNAHTKACLVHADLADGTADKVIRKCPACSLTMDGSESFKATLEGYETHSCSAECKVALENDPNMLFAALKCATPEK